VNLLTKRWNSFKGARQWRCSRNNRYKKPSYFMEEIQRR